MPETLTSTLVDLRLAALKALSVYLTAQCLNTESIMKAVLCHICV